MAPKTPTRLHHLSPFALGARGKAPSLIQSFGLCVVGLFLVYSYASIAWAAPPTATIEMLHSYDRYVPGGTYPVMFKINIEDGWGIHGPHESEEGLIPSRLAFDSSLELKIASVVFPKPKKIKYEYTSETIEVFTNEVLVEAWLKIQDTQPSVDVALRGRFSYQACSAKSCRPPETVPIVIPIPIAAEGESVNRLNGELLAPVDKIQERTQGFIGTGRSSGLWLTLIGIFVAGLALNLTPCIYPLIPITVSYFGGRSEDIQRNTLVHGVLYLTGLSITNSILGVTAALTGVLVGVVLQNPMTLIFISSVMIALALSFFGLWELRAPQFLTRVASRNHQGYFGTFFMGLTLGIVAAPCVGPFILGLLTWVSQIGDPLLGFLYFFVFSIGMGLPLCVLAVFSGSLTRLPKSGDWMIWVRMMMGWVLVGGAAYIVKPIITATVVKEQLVFIVLIAAGLHLGFLVRTGAQSARFKRIKRSVGIFLCLAGILLMINSGRPETGVLWQPYDSKALAEAKNASRPVMLDFYADWCLPCKKLDHGVFTDPRVIEMSQSFLTIRLDLTRRKPDQDKILKEYQVRGVPAVLFFDPDGREQGALRLEAYVEADEFVSLMKRALRGDPID